MVDAGKFPHGLKPVADYVHAQGLKLGLWFGHSMCQASNDIRTQTAASAAAAAAAAAPESWSRKREAWTYGEGLVIPSKNPNTNACFF